MILTEEEAKTKRCQESFGDRHTTKDGMITSRSILSGTDPVVTSPSFCITSACMAWRWAHLQQVEGEVYALGSPPRGFCGKAGKP